MQNLNEPILIIEIKANEIVFTHGYMDDQLIFNKPSIYSKPYAILKKGRLCRVHKCKEEWCKISVDKYKGWVKKDILWGLL